MKEKKTKKRIRIVLALVLVAVVAVFAATLSNALAFEGYEIDKNNDFIIEVKNKKASSTATVKYKTGNWYIFQLPIDGKNKTYSSESVWTDDLGGIPLDLSTKVGSTYEEGNTV